MVPPGTGSISTMTGSLREAPAALPASRPGCCVARAIIALALVAATRLRAGEDPAAETSRAWATNESIEVNVSVETSTWATKKGLAQMLKGGVIMDVVTPDQARIAEDAGAVAVMALERVPADIRATGGVARMSDPALISAIMDAVTIPVMAKARIGHFVEAQVLEALGVDYIDESEVLTPADEANHIDKHAFNVPFVCGARDLGEALRRINEGAAMMRTKGEAGTGDIVEAVRHIRAVNAGIRELTSMRQDELFAAAKELGAPVPARGRGRRQRTPPGRQLRGRGHRHAGGRRPRHAARCRGRLRRLGHLQVRAPGHHRQRHRPGHHPLRRPAHRRGGLTRTGGADARPGRRLGA